MRCCRAARPPGGWARARYPGWLPTHRPAQPRRRLALAEIGIDIFREFPKPLTAGKVQAADVVKGRQVRAGDQGVPQGADSGASRSDAGFGIHAGLPLACRMASDEIRLLQ
jgi:hypothetical protein